MISSQLIHKCLKSVGRYTDNNHDKMSRQNDQILVEFPKSGITYLSVLLSNLYVDKDVNVNYFNINTFVRDSHFNLSKANDCLNVNLNLIKSHYEFSPSYRNILHLFRDPIDVMISYYNYFLVFNKNIKIGDFGEFIRSRRGVVRWNSHTESYFNMDLSVRYMPINYQRAVENPWLVCKVHSTLLGLKLDPTIIDKAIVLSSRRNMTGFESAYNSGGRGIDGELFTGEKVFSKQNVSPEDLRFIESSTKENFQRLSMIEERFYKSMSKNL